MFISIEFAKELYISNSSSRSVIAPVLCIGRSQIVLKTQHFDEETSVYYPDLVSRNMFSSILFQASSVLGSVGSPYQSHKSNS